MISTLWKGLGGLKKFLTLLLAWRLTCVTARKSPRVTLLLYQEVSFALFATTFISFGKVMHLHTSSLLKL